MNDQDSRTSESADSACPQETGRSDEAARPEEPLHPPDKSHPLAADRPQDAARPQIDVGLVLAGSLDDIDREAVNAARRQLTEELHVRLPDFTWNLALVTREQPGLQHREEPGVFLLSGQAERDAWKWDLVFVITAADLIGHYKPFAFATVSRTLDLAVLSTARIDPGSVDTTVDRATRIRLIAERLVVLLFRCLGHLNGLDAVADRDNLMSDAEDVAELDRMRDLTDEQRAVLTRNLHAVADPRLEEEATTVPMSTPAFLVKAAWTQRREIAASVREARPWQFPIHLSRLTTAAGSAMIVLLLTAETWDFALSQSLLSVALLMLVIVGLTTVHVVMKQQLLVRRQDRPLSEQIAVSNISSVAIVLSGLTSTLLLLFVVSLTLSLLLWSDTVVESWAASIGSEIAARHYRLMCGVVAAFSLAIGALGAAFEEPSYFRHVIFVDEEL